MYFVHSCTSEFDDPSNDAGEQLNKEQLISDAMRIYNSYFPEEGLLEIRATQEMKNAHSAREAKDMPVAPLWEHASVSENGKHRAAEILLTSEKDFSYAFPEAGDKFKKTGDRRYRQSKTNFVYIADKSTGEETMFMMTVMPELSYTESTKFKPFDKMSYLHRDKNFSGVIFYRNMKGEYVNGWYYSEGKIIGKVNAHTESTDFEMVQTRATDCYDLYLVYYVTECSFWGNGNSENQGWDCYSYYEYEYRYTFCNYNYDDNDDGYYGAYDWNGGGGGGNNSGNSKPTVPTQVTLSGPGIITVTDSYDLEVSITPSNVILSSVVFKINNQYELQSGTALSCYSPARKPGIWTITAIVNGVTSNSKTVEVQFPDINEIASNGTVRNAMNAAWADTKAAASTRVEKGFSITLETSGSGLIFSCGEIQTGPPSGCVGERASIYITGQEGFTANPLNGGRYRVADFHTHPPLTYCPSGSDRDAGFSDEDNDAFVPQLLYDYVGEKGIIEGGHAIDAPAMIYMMGSRRTSYPY